jgi:hypothetical protein
MNDLQKAESILNEYSQNNVSVNKPNNKGGFKVWLSGGLLDNPTFYKYVNDPVALYLLFRNYEIRGRMRNPLYKRIKREYFDNGHIACALSFSKIEEKTGWYRSKISRYIKKLEEYRWVRIDRIDVGKKEKHNVYILGRINNLGDDIYFIDEIINSSQE